MSHVGKTADITEVCFWPEAVYLKCAVSGRFRGTSGLSSDVVNATRMTQNGHWYQVVLTAVAR